MKDSVDNLEKVIEELNQIILTACTDSKGVSAEKAIALPIAICGNRVLMKFLDMIPVNSASPGQTIFIEEIEPILREINSEIVSRASQFNINLEDADKWHTLPLDVENLKEWLPLAIEKAKSLVEQSCLSNSVSEENVSRLLVFTSLSIYDQAREVIAQREAVNIMLWSLHYGAKTVPNSF